MHLFQPPRADLATLPKPSLTRRQHTQHFKAAVFETVYMIL